MSVIETRTLLKSAAALIAALAWNDAAKSIIDYLFPLGTEGSKHGMMVATIIYALFVTMLIIVIIAIFNYTTVKVKQINNKYKENYIKGIDTSIRSIGKKGLNI